MTQSGTQKKEAFSLLFSCLCSCELLHNELLGVGTGVHEVDAAGQAVDVDAVGTSLAFLAHHLLTHDVVDHDLSVLAEGDVEAVNGGVRIDVHVNVVVVANLGHTVVPSEQVGDVEGEAHVKVVASIGVVALDISARGILTAEITAAIIRLRE